MNISISRKKNGIDRSNDVRVTLNNAISTKSNTRSVLLRLTHFSKHTFTMLISLGVFFDKLKSYGDHTGKKSLKKGVKFFKNLKWPTKCIFWIYKKTKTPRDISILNMCFEKQLNRSKIERMRQKAHARIFDWFSTEIGPKMGKSIFRKNIFPFAPKMLLCT